ADLTGYEIHQGRSEVSSGVPVMTAVGGSSKRESACVGCARPDGLVWGTYVHGIFDHDSFRRAVVNGLRVRKGLSPLGTTYSYVAAKEREYNRLADTVRAHLDMEAVRRIMRGEQ
ncbi:MAG: cobyric acid synthase CobQ, partial [Megasphaera lornae]